MKKLKITMLPAPGGYSGQGQSGSYDQHEFKVPDEFSLDILDESPWFQFEDTDGTEYAFPMQRIAAFAVQEA